jgi:acyl-CoA dehydrogenase
MHSPTLSKPLDDYCRELREWAATECRPHAREADRNHALPANWREILDTAPVPLGRYDRPDADPFPEFSDGHWVSRLAFYEAAAYGDVWVPQAIANGIGHLVVQTMGTAEQIERWYTPVIERAWTTGFGLTEPHFGSDTSQVATTAVRDGDHWLLNGTKIFTSYGATADYTVVFATVDKALGSRAIRAFVVERNTPGMEVPRVNEQKMGIRAWVTSTLTFDNCRIPVENALGWTGSDFGSDLKGQAGALATLALNRPNIAGMAIGIAQAALDVATDLLVAQKPSFSTNRWARVHDDLTCMNDALDRGRRVARRAQQLLDAGHPDRSAPAIAKAYAPQTCERVVLRCMQLLGPEGTSEELLLEKWYRDLKIMDIFEGSGQIQRLIVSRDLFARATR